MEWSRRSEPEVCLKGSGISIGDGDVPGLHWNKFLVGLEVIVGGEYSRADKLLLKDRNEVKQVLWMVVADVVDFVGRYRESVLSVGTFGCMLHHAHHSLHNIVDVCEITLAVAVVEDLDLLSIYQFVGESEICHVGTSARAVDCEKPQARGGNVVKLGVRVGHQLVALLGGGIEAHGVVDLVIGAVGHLLVGAVDTRAAGVDQMVDGIVAASLEDVVEPYEVALYICVGIGDGISHTGLSCEIHHYRRMIFSEYLVDGIAVGYAVVDENETVAEGGEFVQPFVLEADVVIIRDGVDADYSDVGVIG